MGTPSNNPMNPTMWVINAFILALIFVGMWDGFYHWVNIRYIPSPLIKLFDVHADLFHVIGSRVSFLAPTVILFLAWVEFSLVYVLTVYALGWVSFPEDDDDGTTKMTGQPTELYNPIKKIHSNLTQE